jgi:hypothetical protein
MTSQEISDETGAGPRRRIELALNLQADDWKEVARVLENFALSIERGEHRSGDGISVGWASSHTYRVTEHPDQDGDRYRAQNAAYMARIRAERKPSAPVPADSLEAS